MAAICLSILGVMVMGGWYVLAGSPPGFRDFDPAGDGGVGQGCYIFLEGGDLVLLDRNGVFYFSTTSSDMHNDRLLFQQGRASNVVLLDIIASDGSLCAS